MKCVFVQDISAVTQPGEDSFSGLSFVLLTESQTGVLMTETLNTG